MSPLSALPRASFVLVTFAGLTPVLPAQDCNGNGVDDALDILNGTSEDCNATGVPDECELVEVAWMDYRFDGGSLPPGASLSESGLWHVGTACRPAGTCGESDFAYFGIDSSCNFNTGNLFGDSGYFEFLGLSLPDASQVTLSFCSYYDGEGGTAGDEYDLAIVYARETGTGGSGDLLEFTSGTNSPSEWETRTLDLTPYAGAQLDLRFFFNSGDDFANGGFGWGLDNVRITHPGDEDGNGLLDSCECVVENYCVTSPNTVGAGAHIQHGGTVEVHRNDFALITTELPPGQFGVYYYGPVTTQVPFGDGVRCVASPNHRLPVVSTGVGTATFAFDYLDWSHNPGNHVFPGITQHFQFWYRDHLPGGTTFNLSEGLRVTFCE